MNVALLGLAALIAADGVVARQWQAQTHPDDGAGAVDRHAAATAVCRAPRRCPRAAPDTKCCAWGATAGSATRTWSPTSGGWRRRRATAKLGLVVVGDLSQPRGGPTPSGHRSHQTGLDADIGYAAPAGVRAGHLSRQAREQLSPLAVIDLKTHETTGAWTPAVAKLLALAAADPAVDRIFVNPAIKKLLCAGPTAKAPWQGRLRPWWAHHDHFHVRLKCPADSPQCVPQDPPPDDGCGATLAWWFSEDADGDAHEEEGGGRRGRRSRRCRPPASR